MRESMSKWMEEELEPGMRVAYKLKTILSSCQSKFQTVDVVDLDCFGRSLVIDGLIQSCQVDEFVYHESLVHPALLAHPCPKSVYIGGGGEGSTAREVLRHSTVERCVMVDIDEDVVRFCREHLPENSAAFSDPRLELIIDDAKAVLEKSGRFDVIIMDLDDPLEGGPCYQLYTTEFYQMIKAKLNPGHRKHTKDLNGTLRMGEVLSLCRRQYTHILFYICGRWHIRHPIWPGRVEKASSCVGASPFYSQNGVPSGEGLQAGAFSFNSATITALLSTVSSRLLPQALLTCPGRILVHG